MNCARPMDGGPMISPTRTLHGSAEPKSSRDSACVVNVVPLAESDALDAFDPSPDEQPGSAKADAAATPASAANDRRVIS